MTILSCLYQGSRLGLCGVFLLGAAAGCSSDDSNTMMVDLGPAAPPDSGPTGPSPVSTVNLSPDKSLIKFDDGIYSSMLHKLIVPGAATGNLFLVDPDTLGSSTITGFAKMAGSPNGGITSAAEGNGLLYLTNQTDNKLYVVDPMSHTIAGTVALAAAPDYIRYVMATNELWITEPDVAQKIEVFSLKSDPRKPRHSTNISIAGGPEGLAIDDIHNVAYTTSGANSMTIAIDVQRHTMKSSFASGCADPKGAVVDPGSGVVFIGCAEGGVTAIDPTQGKMVSQLKTVGKVDAVGFSPTLSHLYIPGEGLSIASLSAGGMLTLLGHIATPGSATKRAIADDTGHAWVFQPATGQVLRVQDTYQGSH